MRIQTRLTDVEAGNLQVDTSAFDTNFTPAEDTAQKVLDATDILSLNPAITSGQVDSTSIQTINPSLYTPIVLSSSLSFDLSETILIQYSTPIRVANISSGNVRINLSGANNISYVFNLTGQLNSGMYLFSKQVIVLPGTTNITVDIQALTGSLIVYPGTLQFFGGLNV